LIVLAGFRRGKNGLKTSQNVRNLEVLAGVQEENQVLKYNQNGSSLMVLT